MADEPEPEPTETPPEEEDQLPAVVLPKPPWKDPEIRGAFLEAIRRGDKRGVMHAFLGPDAILDDRWMWISEYIIELRRLNVAVIGAHDVFVRRTPSGELQQVVAAVKLSLADGTLYRIPDRRVRFISGTDMEWQWPGDKGKRYEWRDVFENPFRAHLTAPGYQKCNGVAGCSIAQPPQVIVDSEVRENPYVVRNPDGDITRIVIQQNVAGPAPLTGNVVVVQYVLDLSPVSDLQHMLSNLMKRRKDGDDDDDHAGPRGDPPVLLIDKTDWPSFREQYEGADRWRWKWLPLYSGVGIAHDLTNDAVKRAYDKFIGIMEHVHRKAQTVARRNAMKAHPALATQSVVVNNHGEATVRVIGWTGAGGDLDTYTAALESIARGLPTPGLDVLQIEAGYDPASDLTGDDTIDAVVPPDAEEPVGEANADLERNRLIEAIDSAVVSLSPRDAHELGYPPPDNATIDQLRAILGAIRGDALPEGEE